MLTINTKKIRPYNKQSGQAMAETIIILGVILLLVLGAIQFALIYHAKVTLNYATFEAARAGALNHASRRSIEYAFARGIAPLYAYSPSGSSMLDNVSNLKGARNRVMTEVDGNDPTRPDDAGDQFVCIERLNPTREAFLAHGIPDPNRFFASNVIPNDNLLYRSTDDKGTSTSIQDANLLKVRITYCYPLYIPFISTLIRKLMLGSTAKDPDVPPGWTTPTVGNFQSNCYANNRIPIVAQSIIRMQTPAINDVFRTNCN